MKKAVAIILCIIVVVGTVSGCGSKRGKPEHMSEAYYQFGIKALEITDEYLNMSASARDVYNRLNDLDKNAGLPDAFGSDTYSDSGVETSVTLILVRLNGISLSTDYNDVLDARNGLAEKLNEPVFGE